MPGVNSRPGLLEQRPVFIIFAPLKNNDDGRDAANQ